MVILPYTPQSSLFFEDSLLLRARIVDNYTEYMIDMLYRYSSMNYINYETLLLILFKTPVRSKLLYASPTLGDKIKMLILTVFPYNPA